MYPPYPQMPAAPAPQKKDIVFFATRIAILIILLIILVFVIAWVFGCSIIPFPGFCDIYWGLLNVTGKPSTLIVYGDSGLGNPEVLALTLSDPKGAGVRTTQLELSRISPGVLKKFTLVIVTHARKMSASQMKMFIDYVNLGGRLVWTGDAGAEVTQLEGESKEQAISRELLFMDENPEYDVNEHKQINPWARKLDGKLVRFDQVISARYLGNYCDQLSKADECENKLPYLGMFQLNDQENPTVIGLRNNLRIYGNIAMVDIINSGTTTKVADVGKPVDIGPKKTYPLIIQSGFGGRILYYALPPEEFVNPEIPSDEEGNPQTAPHLISNMYTAAIK